ncbi:pH-gated potassium channel KcsA [Burkholderia sp. AD24]|nr:pH-gated potassium channel KcsA [Burkholderia sp. AD24]
MTAEINPREAVSEVTKVLWRLRGVLLTLLGCFLICAVPMYEGGGAINTVTRTGSSLGETLYFCAITALTIGYGDVVPTTTLGRIVAVLLGFLGVLITGVVTASTVYGIQLAAQKAHPPTQ